MWFWLKASSETRFGYGQSWVFRKPSEQGGDHDNHTGPLCSCGFAAVYHLAASTQTPIKLLSAKRGLVYYFILRHLRHKSLSSH